MKTCVNGHGDFATTKCAKCRAESRRKRGVPARVFYSAGECVVRHRAANAAWKKKERVKAREQNKRWYARKREAGEHLASHMKSRYGMTQKEYENFLLSTGGECEICHKKGKRLVPDHNHDTGKVRGVLCNKCNSAIGLLGDSVSRHLAAAAYLYERGSYGK